jgi:molybdopterin converting factor subunit 1
MRVLYFAHSRRITGLSHEDIPASTPLSTSDFWDQLIQRHPDLAALRPFSRLARDHDFLAPDALLSPTDEIALIPPVSGG